ncbi:bifunctional [glutamine synthetase] adenylyltransferase/[glutamine synthetase]-adenylyl-L-tyrosine phosphorylase [Rothia sp. HMSC071F11]|uniref:bifunctional [glutamine synthetase] adenylyltransferase/[glutamine synthetase]-adenylyl-L-tyrosine phosphorylase n=1 Tax=Rothia sp. HMSC071F11 TaxID=1715034 RepID=UPI0008A64D6F|nr:bifunctional [glutamine synthetase] adenylyltransferase/[glutamine synthetase]-adenylyl-L-tyrosine phosphorylase [Rothia sp. HMSC071F11]OFN45739.1 bifunctional glutamine-synthetase adenylyltransferase/deadenyltransferase [Rothia sp. HMSC071F11]
MPEQQPTEGTAAVPADAERQERARRRKRMVAAGFYDAVKSERWLDSPELAQVNTDALFAGLRWAPSPDIALPSLVRLIEKHPATAERANRGDAEFSMFRLLGSSQALGDFLYRNPHLIDHVLDSHGLDSEPELIATQEPSTVQAEDIEPQIDPHDVEETPHIRGYSGTAGGKKLDDIDEPTAPLATAYRTDLLEAVGANPDDERPRASREMTGKDGYTALRVAYRAALTKIALVDVCSPDPVELMPTVGRHLADLAAAALEGALAIARTEVAEGLGGGLCSAPARGASVDALDLAIIGMGKCGARELNYISDVDVVYVIAPVPASELPEGVEPLTEQDCAQIGTELVHALTKAIMAPASEPPLWEVDANLRPEGKDGPLVRTVESYVRYYKRWAENWEFQALLKARPIAGSAHLGEKYARAIEPFVWESAARDSFVESVQAMRARVTDNIPAAQLERQIKLGPGGLRDVEFTVQLLQLVHGRTDPAVRTKSTLDSLAALTRASYISRSDTEAFSRDYKKLRLLEHRIQLMHLRRTQLMPDRAGEQRVLARSLVPAERMGTLSAEQMLKAWQKLKRNVRSLHERIFFRPLLAAVSTLSRDEVALSDQAAQDRLAALGYRDPRGAMRHIEALTNGVSRRAEIQRHLMPVLLGWFAEGVDADAGLLGFRLVSESLGTTSWYLRMLRDSPAAAERLCQILSSSRYITDLLEDAPTSITWLDKVADLQPLSAGALKAEITSLLSRHEDSADAMRAVRYLRRREILRIAMGDALNLLSVQQVCTGLATVDECTIGAALALAEREEANAGERDEKTTPQKSDAPQNDSQEATGESLEDEQRNPLLTEITVIAMGRLGGAENGFGSDADVMFVHRPVEGADEKEAQAQANHIVNRLMQLIKQPVRPAIRAERPLEVDADLRPEGKQGALVRSLDSYRAYYERWAETWEFQALLRARPIAGSEDLGRAFVELVNPYRYPREFTVEQVQQVRRMKARVEHERMPHGADRTRQLKLGRGGLSDVEWLVQLIQLQYAHKVEGLRTTSTLEALDAAVQANLVAAEEAEVLRDAWLLATKIRGGNVLRGVRQSDLLPTLRDALEAVARWSGYTPGSARQLEEDYLRVTRNARKVYERLFFEG